MNEEVHLVTQALNLASTASVIWINHTTTSNTTNGTLLLNMNEDEGSPPDIPSSAVLATFNSWRQESAGGGDLFGMSEGTPHFPTGEVGDDLQIDSFESSLVMPTVDERATSSRCVQNIAVETKTETNTVGANTNRASAANAKAASASQPSVPAASLERDERTNSPGHDSWCRNFDSLVEYKRQHGTTEV